MKKTKLLSIALALFMCIGSKESYVFAENSNKIAVNEILGRTSKNTSIYGDDLEDNMVDESPSINSFTLNKNVVSISGYVDSNNKDSKFCLSGTAYKTYDDNIVFDAVDMNNNYEVVFLCLEKNRNIMIIFCIEIA